MIRFFIKMAFFLGLIAMIVPGGRDRDGEPEINLFALLYGAQAAVSDLSGICDRAPSACAAGSDVARFAGERVGDGLAIAYDFVDGAIARRREGTAATAALAAPAPRLAARTDVRTAQPRPDRITTAAIPSARIPAVQKVAIPADRATVATTAGASARQPAQAMPMGNALPTAESRPLPPVRTAARQVAASVPVPVPAPRG